MVDDDGDATFPVVFYDGEREINIGGVRVGPSVEFKGFQMGLSKRIGISPNQITVYLVDRKKSKAAVSTEFRRRVPVTGKVNFAELAKETDCFFLVVLKRSRKSRKPKAKQVGVEYGGAYFLGNKAPPSAPEKLFLLRRTAPELNNPYNQLPYPELADYRQRLQDLEVRRKEYVMAMNPNPTPLPYFDQRSFPRIEEAYNRTSPAPSTTVQKPPSCEECSNAVRNGTTAPFHWCVNDAITVGFRSQAGPIARPRKSVD